MVASSSRTGANWSWRRWLALYLVAMYAYSPILAGVSRLCFMLGLNVGLGTHYYGGASHTIWGWMGIGVVELLSPVEVPLVLLVTLAGFVYAAFIAFPDAPEDMAGWIGFLSLLAANLVISVGVACALIWGFAQLWARFGTQRGSRRSD